MTNNLSNPFKSTCAFCLGTFHLQGQSERPIRHGFTAHNVKHGQNGGWHSDHCMGGSFPHLGVSTEGTKVALKLIVEALHYAKVALAELNSRPALAWAFVPRKYENHKYVPDTANIIKRTLTPGSEASLASYKQPFHGRVDEHQVRVPSYEQELNTRIAEVQAQINNLEAERTKYETVINTWKPFDKVAVVKVGMVHKMIENSIGRKFAACNRHIRVGGASKFTTNNTEVTCKRCQG